MSKQATTDPTQDLVRGTLLADRAIAEGWATMQWWSAASRGETFPLVDKNDVWCVVLTTGQMHTDKGWIGEWPNRAAIVPPALVPHARALWHGQHLLRQAAYEAGEIR